MPSTRIAEVLRPGLKFHIVNLGCKVNRVESDTIAARLRAQGCRLVGESDAQLTIVNTCTVTGEADKKARKAVRRALKVAPRSLVVVTGCAVSIDPGAFASLDERVAAVPKADLLLEISGQSIEPLRMGSDYRTRVNIKIQDGCNRACTFCIVHVARGPSSSVPARSVIEEARAYLESGVKEIVLTGIDLGSYKSGSVDLTALLKMLVEESVSVAGANQQPARIRISSIEPVSIDDELVSLLATSNGLVCRHLHLPLQSGSTKVLRDMSRPYTAEQYCALVEKIRSRVPRISLTTDIICGFPGEKDEEFEQTCSVARFCRFSKIHVFPYSKRPGTPAALRDDQIPADTKERRAAKLRALSGELRDIDRKSRAGDVELALVEGANALTESYHEIELEEDYEQGQLVAVQLG